MSPVLDKLTQDAMEDEESEVAQVEGATPATASRRVKRVLQSLPMVVGFHNRVLVFDHLLSDDRDSLGGHGDRFHHSAAQVQVTRGSEYTDAFEALAGEPDPSVIKGRMQIEFTNAQVSAPLLGLFLPSVESWKL